ncbi:MAG: beta-propeller domain-containing protein [Patescibacteria group bacterium]
MNKKLSYIALFTLVSTMFYPGVTQAAVVRDYDYQIIGQSSYPATLAAGQTTTVWLDIKNTGRKTWDKQVRLGSGSALYGNKNNDYASEFSDSSWLSPNRATAIDKDSVKPGETARLQFVLRTPSSSGTYKAYFTPVVDGISWMKDSGIYWQISVTGGTTLSGFKRVTSEADFKSYLTASTQSRGSVIAPTAIPTPSPAPTPTTGSTPDSVTRTSETNVQVQGIDEPDMVKVTGENIIYSQRGFYYPYITRGGFIPQQQTSGTKIIDAVPAKDIQLKNTITRGGELLLDTEKNILMVFDYPEIIAYDITDINNPVQKWNITLKDSTYIDTARFTNGNLYVVTKRYINTNTPCTITPLVVNGTAFPISCTNFYRPIAQTSSDTVYTAIVVQPTTGSISKSTSFIGSSSDSQVYMSENALYISSSSVAQYATFYTRFILDRAQGLLPAEDIAHLQAVQGYAMSDIAKQTEFDYTIEQYTNSLTDDAQTAFRTELANRQKAYVDSQVRQLETTSIAKISLSDFSLSATGSVPGYLLNQFSLDEYQGKLRVATTIGNRFYWGSTTVNDVYVLGEAMNELGSVKNLGTTERIYSARFVGDKGYLVTFRQIDPFYVLDLANPAAPKVSGELKIPGYSSYLHPVNNSLVIGVGKENNQVKVSLFDVTNPATPTEVDKYYLNEYWTDVQNNHHAFLLDSKHSVFFIPGGTGGYVISYEGNKLTLKKAVSGTGIKRAVYINDTMYILSDTKVTAINETTWENEGELGL